MSQTRKEFISANPPSQVITMCKVWFFDQRSPGEYNMLAPLSHGSINLDIKQSLMIY